MNTGIVYFISVIVSILLYLALYCSLNKYNCIRNNGLNLPLGYAHFIGPWVEIIKGRFDLGFRMIFLSLNTPYLFIFLGLIATYVYLNFIKTDDVEEEDKEEDKEDEVIDDIL